MMVGGDAGVLLDDADLFKGQFKGVYLVKGEVMFICRINCSELHVN